MRKLGLPVLTGLVLFLGLAQLAWSVPMFARMYSYNCSTCHYPGYGQLNKFGWEFRDAGFRVPADIGKELHDGKVDVANYVAARFSAGGTLKTTTQPNNAPVPDSATFTLGGASLYLGGPVNKNFGFYSEFGLGNGTGVFPGSAPSLSMAFVSAVTGSEKEYFTLRAGKFNQDGFGPSDRGPIGSPSINSAVKPTGTGLEVGYTNNNTRIALAFYNGIQNSQYTGLVQASGTTVKGSTTSTLSSPSSDTNNAKDIQLFVNQFLNDDGLAVNALFYNGFNDSGISASTTSVNADRPGVEFYATALYLNVPVVKNFDFKTGLEFGQSNIGVFQTTGSASDPAGGFFGEVTYEADEITPVVLRVDYTSSDLNVDLKGDTIKTTLGALTPFVENVYMNPTYTLTMTDAAAGYTYAHQLSDSLFVFF